jgi:hypothetical protein
VNTTPGDLICRSHDPHDGTNVEVLHADPVVWASEEFLDMARCGALPAVLVSPHGACELMTITARNRTLVYRIGSYDFVRHAYLCNWPD